MHNRNYVETGSRDTHPSTYSPNPTLRSQLPVEARDRDVLSRTAGSTRSRGTGVSAILSEPPTKSVRDIISSPVSDLDKAQELALREFLPRLIDADGNPVYNQTYTRFDVAQEMVRKNPSMGNAGGYLGGGDASTWGNILDLFSSEGLKEYNALFPSRFDASDLSEDARDHFRRAEQHMNDSNSLETGNSAPAEFRLAAKTHRRRRQPEDRCGCGEAPP